MIAYFITLQGAIYIPVAHPTRAEAEAMRDDLLAPYGEKSDWRRRVQVTAVEVKDDRHKRKDHAHPGDRFGCLTIDRVYRGENYRYFAVVSCDCGRNPFHVRIERLRDGVVTSCGCATPRAPASNAAE